MNEFCASQGSGAVTFFRCGGQKWTNTYHLCQISPGFRVAYFDRNFFFKIIRWRFREQYHLLLPMFRGLCIVFVCVCWAHWWSCWAHLWFPQKSMNRSKCRLGCEVGLAQKCPFPWGNWASANTLFLGLTKVPPKRRLDRINRFARLAAVPNRQVHADIMDNGTSLHLYSS